MKNIIQYIIICLSIIFLNGCEKEIVTTEPIIEETIKPIVPNIFLVKPNRKSITIPIIIIIVNILNI